MRLIRPGQPVSAKTMLQVRLDGDVVARFNAFLKETGLTRSGAARLLLSDALRSPGTASDDALKLAAIREGFRAAYGEALEALYTAWSKLMTSAEAEFGLRFESKPTSESESESESE